MASSKLSKDGTGEKCVGTYDAERFLTEKENEIRIVLVGRTGSGISASGNSILKQDCFKSDSSGSSVTKTCCIGTTERGGKIVKVVDTPGLFGNIMSVDEIKLEILNCFTLISPGPHVIVYVLRIRRFTKEEIQGVKRFLHIFGGNPLQYTVILFTGVDDLEWNQVSNEEYLKHAPICLQELVERCNGRYVFFNNRLSSSEESNNQHDDLFEILEDMLNDNNIIKEPYYTNHITTEIGEDEHPSFENKLEEPKYILTYLKPIAGAILVLGSGAVCFGNPSLMPFVGAGMVGIGVTNYFNGLKKPNDEICKGLEEIKVDNINQCTIS